MLPAFLNKLTRSAGNLLALQALPKQEAGIGPIKRINMESRSATLAASVRTSRHHVQPECSDSGAIIAKAFESAPNPLRNFGSAHV